MARRHAWLHCGMGLIACLLVAGCLHTAADRERLFAGSEPAPKQAEKLEPQLRAEAPVEGLSPYGIRPVPAFRLAGAIDPSEERVRLVITPKPQPIPEKEPEKPAPATSPEPPPPAPAKESPLLAALRCVLEKHLEEAQFLLEKYDKPDRDQLLALLRLVANVTASDLPPGEAEQTLEQLHELIRHLKRRAPLALGKVCFCRKIESFGQYHDLPVGHPFQAGCDGRPGERVQVYAEVRNFGSQVHNGQYETLLTSSLEIHDDQRRPVVTMNLGTCIDRSQTARQDYFLNFQFHVPTRLPPGLYTLWVTVKDASPSGSGPASARVAKRSLDFKVCPTCMSPMTP